MVTQDVTAISEYKQQLATVTDMSDIRRILSIAKGLVEATTREYERAKNNHGIEQTKAIKEAAFENAIKAGELRLLAEARFGEMIKQEQEAGRLASQDTGNRNLPDNVVSLKDYGISWKESSRAQKIYEHRDLISSYVVKAMETEDLPTRSGFERMLNPAHVSFNTGENEWYTPWIYVQAAREVMGTIDTDPASSETANGIVKAKQYFTIEDDGRQQTWVGNIWMNPPYSQPLVTEFCALLVEKLKNREIKQACVLVNNATETNFYQNMMGECQAVCFIKGRVKFIDQNGESTGAPLQGQTILYFGEGYQKFAKVFSQFGVVLYA
jgi:ParB family chromosome partitioning protein